MMIGSDEVWTTEAAMLLVDTITILVAPVTQIVISWAELATATAAPVFNAVSPSSEHQPWRPNE